MIVNLNKKNTVQVLKKLEKSKDFKFNLTGSQELSIRPGGLADIDFFTKESKDVIKFLENLGFEKEQFSPYTKFDKGVKSVYIFPGIPLIHVQIIKSENYEMKKQTNIAWFNFLRGKVDSLSKRKKRAIWQALYSAYYQGLYSTHLHRGE